MSLLPEFQGRAEVKLFVFFIYNSFFVIKVSFHVYIMLILLATRILEEHLVCCIYEYYLFFRGNMYLSTLWASWSRSWLRSKCFFTVSRLWIHHLTLNNMLNFNLWYLNYFGGHIFLKYNLIYLKIIFHDINQNLFQLYG